MLMGQEKRRQMGGLDWANEDIYVAVMPVYGGLMDLLICSEDTRSHICNMGQIPLPYQQQ